MTTVVTVPTIVAVAAPGPQGPVGPQGLAGPAGSGTATFTAGITVSGHRMVIRQADGTVTYADWTTVGSAPLWMTLGAASSGATVTAQFSGVVDEPSWTWTPGPLYLGATGLITQTVPTASAGAVFLTQIGFATSPTSVVLDRCPSIRLS